MSLPTGTVTFLFTDIEGSTRLLAQLGPEDYAKALATHRERLRAAFAHNLGVEVGTEGDSFFVAFASAHDAATAAAEAQASLTSGAVRVRMGITPGNARANACHASNRAFGNRARRGLGARPDADGR